MNTLCSCSYQQIDVLCGCWNFSRNLSTNFLSGEIPDVGVLSKFGSKS